MLFEGGFSFTNFLADVFAVFMFVIWFWLLFTVGADLFRRHDISGWGKALWVIAMILVPYIGVLAYLITQGRGMAERQNQQVERAREELRRVVGYSAAEEIRIDYRRGIHAPSRQTGSVAAFPSKCRVRPIGARRKICRPGHSAGSRTAAP